MKKTRKFGIEYEGILTWKASGNPIKFSELDFESRKSIREALGEFNPFDGNEYLAELRLGPFIVEKNTNSFNLSSNIAQQFLEKVDQYNEVFAAHGVTIMWCEEEVPKEVVLDAVAMKLEWYNHKELLRMSSGGVKTVAETSIKNNKLYGGGLHLNFSGLLHSQHAGTILALHRLLDPIKEQEDYSFKSVYRTGCKWRDTRYQDPKKTVPGIEYLSIGLNSPKYGENFNLKDYNDYLKTTSNIFEAAIRSLTLSYL